MQASAIVEVLVGRDAVGIKARANEKVSDFWGFAQNEIAIWRDGLRPVGQGPDVRRLESRDPDQGLFHELLELVPIFIEQGEHQTLRNLLHVPRLGIGLIATHDQATSSDPIKIPTHNWSSQIVGAQIVGELLKKAGASVEYVSADSQVVYTSMCEGDIHLVHEVWQGAFGVAFEKVVGEGCVIDAATHDAKTREEWWYPKYVEEMCPGLPDWEALNACADKFTTPETAPKGRFLAGPVDWLKHDSERVEGLGMNFEVVNAGSAAALWAELKSASQQKQPIVLFSWTPNFIEAIYEGGFVEFPDYAEGCREDPSGGMNKDKAYDCGNPKDGYLKIGVWKDFEATWPKAYAVLKNINFTNLDVAVMAKLADVDEMEPDAAAAKWLAENEDRWQAWLNAGS